MSDFFFYTQREWYNVEIENETNIGEGLSLLIDAAVDKSPGDSAFPL